MMLIQNGTQGPTTVPTKQTPSGTPGYANSGTPGAFTPTIFDPDMGNTLIAEIVNTVLGAGLSLDPTNNAQLLAAIKLICGLESESSLGTNGWKKYPDPTSPTGYYIEQWGVASIPSNGSTSETTAVNLPMTYPTTHLWCAGGFDGTTPPATGSVSAQPLNNSQLNMTVNTPASASNGVWFLSKGC